MKKIKAKNYFPYPSQESFEDALNIIAEIRAENYFWTKKIWYVEQKIKKFANDDINREFYVRLRDKLDEKICNSHTIYIDLLMDITKVTGIKKKITKKFVQMTDELILQDRRSNDYFDIKNQPFPFEDKLNSVYSSIIL